MKLISNKDMQRIKEKFNHFESEKIILDSGEFDKDKAINYMIGQLTYLYAKLGLNFQEKE